MAIFGTKSWVYQFEKVSIFRLSEFLVFIAQKGVFSFQNIVKDKFLAYMLRKKKVGKMAIFGPKRWVNPFGKMSIFRLFKLLPFIPSKGVFSFQNIVKDMFLANIAQKKKVGRMAIFGRKPWVNHFGKMSIFQLFKRLVFISKKGVFLFQNIVKDNFLGYTALKKKFEKCRFLD